MYPKIVLGVLTFATVGGLTSCFTVAQRNIYRDTPPILPALTQKGDYEGAVMATTNGSTCL